MVDSADMAFDDLAVAIEDGVRRARNAILPGIAGYCDRCEWWMPRLVDGRCCFCRDGRQRPPDWEPPTPPDAIVPEPIREKPTMPDTKSVTVVVSGPVLEELKRLTADGTSYTRAGMALFERALGTAAPIAADEDAPSSSPALSPRQRMFAALDVVGGIAAELLDRPDSAADLAAAIARADAAENEAESLRELLKETTERANRFAERLDAMRGLLTA